MALTAAGCRAPMEPGKYFDGGGLFLHVTQAGGKFWRFKFRFNGKEKLLSIGGFPLVTLAEARIARDNAKRLLNSGVDPTVHKRAIKQAEAERGDTVAAIALEFLNMQKQSGVWTPGHARTVESRIRRDIIPWIGDRPIRDVTAGELLKCLRRVEARGAVESAHRIQVILGQIFRYAIATERADTDPSRDLRGALQSSKPKHFPAPLDPARIGELLRMFDGYAGSPIVRSMLRIGPYVFVRPGELRTAQWEDIDLDAAEWRFVASKTKTQHIVPLARQVIATLEEMKPVTGGGRFVFPSLRSFLRPASNNAVTAAYRSLGIISDELVGHSWRAVARTLLVERLDTPVELIELQLAHTVRGPLGRAYDRTEFLKERRAMMQKWADYLDSLK